MKIEINEAAEFLRSHDNFLILMHASPDGDTLGCGFALCTALQRMGKKAEVICPDEIPHRFDYMREGYTQMSFDINTYVAVDVADVKLLGDLSATFADKVDLCIDHHVSNTHYAKQLLLREHYASACELMFEVITALGTPIDRIIANCLYTGVATDTGCFKFSNTKPQTHIVAAKLMECGAEIAPINYAMFELKTQGRIKLEQEVLRNMRYFADGHIAMVTVTLETLAGIADIDSDDVGAMASIPRQIEGVWVGVTMRQKPDGEFKISVRTGNHADASLICKELGGGGHIRAAGCEINKPLNEAVDILLDTIKRVIPRITQ